MLKNMAILAQPNYIEFEFISSVMVGVWIAVLVAFGALVWTNEFSGSDRVVNSQSCPNVVSIVFEVCAAVLTPFVGVFTEPCPRFGVFSFALSGGPVFPLTNRISRMFTTPFLSIFGCCHAWNSTMEEA